MRPIPTGPSGRFITLNFLPRSERPITSPKYGPSSRLPGRYLDSGTWPIRLVWCTSPTGKAACFPGVGTAFMPILFLQKETLLLVSSPGSESLKLLRMMTTPISLITWGISSGVRDMSGKAMFSVSCHEIILNQALTRGLLSLAGVFRSGNIRI